jgi:uncharacterized protein
MKLLKSSFLLVIILFTFLMGQADLPDKPESWVSDDAGILSVSEKNILNAMLGNLEQRSSNQIFVAIFNNLPQNYYLEDYAVKLYEKWRPGLEKQDNGLLILVFIEDRQMRIEVGYGLEDVITDAQSSVIINQYITPEFRQGNYFTGLKSALDVLIPAVEGKYKIPLEKQSEGERSPLGIIIIILVIFFIMSRFGGNKPGGIGSKTRGKYSSGPFMFGGFGGFGGGSSGGGGFSGGFGGLSGGGGASGRW